MFKDGFRSDVCEGDSIECNAVAGKHRSGFRFVATIYRDDTGERPDEMDEGFWPSRDPEAGGYVLPENYAAEMEKAEQRMAAWRADEWFYCGVAVRAWFDDIPLTGEFDHALWGIESDCGDYLTEVANDLLSQCEPDAIRRLTEIVEAGAEALTD